MSVKINKDWHLANKMPKNPTFEQRMKWHIGHAKNCACREIPPKLQEEINKYKNSLEKSNPAQK